MAGGNISIIGPRSSGKTTYLAALAYHENHKVGHKKGVQYTVTAQNPEARTLKQEAEIILLRGGHFKATNIGDSQVFEFPFYAFSIDYKPNRFTANKRIQITTRDYPGEVFRKLAKTSSLNTRHEEFVSDCFKNKVGCVVLLSGWELGKDNEYRNMLRNFITLMNRSNVDSNYKLAVAMSKCERGEIWPGRIEPEEDLFHIHLRKTKELLREKVDPKNLKFFALSTFGVMGRNNPRPNREDRIVKGEPASVLRNPEQWTPYNLIEPLIWISKSSET